jgi:multiple sugar transport system substrate-binding protein
MAHDEDALTADIRANAVSVGGSAAEEVTGAFDWRRASGKTIKILQTPHAYQQSLQPLLQEFTQLTGVQVEAHLVAEADYFTKLKTELASRSGAHDIFMTGAYFIWQYGPRGWMEDLRPWLDNTAATNADYDFEDIYEGLRTSTRWDLEPGSPLGTGGQWAIPWGFETNVITYNKQVFDQKGIKPADKFDDFIQLAIDLTDRSKNEYGVSFRGSRSWATIHAGFMTQYTREGAKDYEASDGKLVAVMNSDKAVEFTRKWVQLAKEAGPTSWPQYRYTDVSRDLGNGSALMVYDADGATYPKNRPGASKEAGNLAWHPGPAGPDGNYATNLWTWSLAMSSASNNKLAAWLFIQWATGKDAMTKAAGAAFADPTRKSVFDGAFKQTLGGFPGYLETFETVVDQTKVQFTPQMRFFETTQDWAVALQEIYAGQDAKTCLAALAMTSTEKVNV